MQWVCEGFWLLVVVEPLTGEQFFYEFSHLDSLCFQRFITLFAQQHPQEFHIWHLDRARLTRCQAITTTEKPSTINSAIIEIAFF